VCLFGPCSPEHYGFEDERVAILYRPVVCSPCAHEVERPPCAGDNVCMQLIEPGAVVAAAAALASAPGATAPAAEARRPPVEFVDGRGRALGLVVRGSVG
jgi:hypothetical protein